MHLVHRLLKHSCPCKSTHVEGGGGVTQVGAQKVTIETKTLLTAQTTGCRAIRGLHTCGPRLCAALIKWRQERICNAVMSASTQINNDLKTHRRYTNSCGGWICNTLRINKMEPG